MIISDKEFCAQEALGTLTFKVKRSLAGERKLSNEIRRHLAHDPDWPVRHAVAVSSNTPMIILHELTKDEIERVRMSAKSNTDFRNRHEGHLYKDGQPIKLEGYNDQQRN